MNVSTPSSSLVAAADASPAARRAAQLAQEPFQPAGPTSGFLHGTKQSVIDILSYRRLLNLLFRRELKARYKDSALGFFWSLMRPLAQLLVYTIAVGKFLSGGRGGSDYAIFVFSGLTIWQLFSEIVSSGTGAILANAGLVKKVYLPREVFILGVVASAIFGFVIQLGILTIGTFITGAPLQPERLWYGVLAALVIVVFGTGVAFILSAVNVYLRDVQYLVEIGLMWGMWMSPIVYRWSFVSKDLHNAFLQKVYLANPITEAVLGFQRAFWTRGESVDTIDHLGRNLCICLAGCVVFLWVAQRVFARLQANFAQEL